MRTKLFSVSIHDCRVDTFCSGGKGGQHQNATKSGVRITHEPSGAVAESRETRYQHVNKVRAFRRLAVTKAFKAWVQMEAAKRSGEQTIDQQVDALMDPANLKVEVHDGQGRWVCES